MDLITLLNNPFNQLIFLILMVWAMAWKGIALWKSAQHHQRNWFVVLLITNTFGILEIIYVFYFQSDKVPKTGNQI